MYLTSRRLFLGGAAVSLALPPLESLGNWLPQAQAANNLAQRFVVMFAPNGRHIPSFRPSAYGSNFTLPTSLQPLAPWQANMLLVSNLFNQAATVTHPNSLADAHARAASTVLTGKSIVDSKKVQLGISMDQVLAQTIPQSTRFPSLQWASAVPGACDAALCLYNQTISWANPTTPLPPLTNPKLAFEQLFAGVDSNATTAERLQRQQRQASILDYVLADTKSLASKVSKYDQQELDAYYTNIREIERIANTPVASGCDPGSPPGPVLDYQVHVAFFRRLMVLALKCDLTRIISFMLEYDVAHRLHPFLNSNEIYHRLSHYSTPEQLEQLIRIETWQTTQVAALAEDLAATSFAGSNLLDNTTIYYLPSMGSGTVHNYNDMTVALLTSNNKLKRGVHIDASNNLLANFNLAVLESLGCSVNTLGEDGKSVMRSVFA